MSTNTISFWIFFMAFSLMIHYQYMKIWYPPPPSAGTIQAFLLWILAGQIVYLVWKVRKALRDRE